MQRTDVTVVPKTVIEADDDFGQVNVICLHEDNFLQGTRIRFVDPSDAYRLANACLERALAMLERDREQSEDEKEIDAELQARLGAQELEDAR